jgi:hypothetical protein
VRGWLQGVFLFAWREEKATGFDIYRAFGQGLTQLAYYLR